jgi:hypothetical protein
MEPKKTHVEKRKYPRIRQQMSFEIRENDSVIIADMVNLSGVGAYCRVNKPLALMTNLRIVLPLIYKDRVNDVEYVECDGTVVRTERVLTDEDSYYVAIFFNGISPSEQKKITDYIEAHQQSEVSAPDSPSRL